MMQCGLLPHFGARSPCYVCIGIRTSNKIKTTMMIAAMVTSAMTATMSGAGCFTQNSNNSFFQPDRGRNTDCSEYTLSFLWLQWCLISSPINENREAVFVCFSVILGPIIPPQMLDLTWLSKKRGNHKEGILYERT